MFYVKTEIAEGVTIRAEITGENVFTACPECGREHQVDLAAIVEFDLCGTVVYCDECSKRRELERTLDRFRGLDLDRWAPDEADKPELVAYFKDYYEGIKDCCGDGEEAEEALELYRLVEHNPLRFNKSAIQDHFVDMFLSVGGEIETYYDKSPEIIRLINLTIAPDPLREE